MQNAMDAPSSSHKNVKKMTNDEDIIDYFLDNNPDWVICEFYKRGNCKFGDDCKHLHPKSLLTETQPTKYTDSNGRTQFEGDDECVICLEKVLANGKRFGILENCQHAFCLDCIRDWRATYDKKVKKTHYRTCPICRSNSYLVIPSSHMIYDGDVKDQLIDEYTEALGNIPCKHFN
jgi:E3 ubiquitin-protein ligase makorin